MPTKVSVGLSKKQGRPDYGSIGASCHVELELDGQILDGDLERFRQHVRRAYVACRETIEDELTRDLSTNAAPNRLNGNGHSATNGNGNNHGQSNGRSVTQSQARAIKAIAGRNRIDLAPMLDRLGVRNVEDLSISDASSLIDELKSQPTAGNGGGR
jgi:hypothetical protein